MGVFLRKYNTAITASTAQSVKIPVIKRGVVDFAAGADWTPTAGDVKVSKDGGAAANIATLPAAVAMGNTAYWEFVFSGAELSCGTLKVTIADSATKAVEDQAFIVETFGNASAMYPPDFTDAVRLGLTALPNAAVSGVGGLLTAPTTANVGTVDLLRITGNTAGPTNLNTIFNTDYATIYDATNKAFLSKLGNFAMGGSSLALTTGAISGTTLTLSGAVTATNASNSINLGTDSIGSTQIAASAVTEIQSGLSTITAADVWAAGTRTLTAGTNIALAKGTGVTGFNDITAAAAATAVWQDTTSGDFTVSSSIGKSLYTTGAAPGASGGLAIVGSAMALTSGERTSTATALWDLADGIETGYTPRQAMRAIAAKSMGLISGAGTGTEALKGLGQGSSGTTRGTATVDSSGNISAWTLNL